MSSKTLITGGCSGIGLALSEHILKRTDGELIVCRNRTPFPDELLSEFWHRLTFIDISLDSYGNGGELATSLKGICSTVHGIVFCHGVNSPGPIEEDDQEEYERIVNTNLSSIYGFFSEGGGTIMGIESIVLVSSFCGRVGGPTTAHYAISKSGLDTLALNLARQLAHKGVRVNSIAPGFVKTRMIGGDISESVRAKILLGRAAEASEIAQVIKFLLSQESSYITGQCISVDGGLRM